MNRSFNVLDVNEVKITQNIETQIAKSKQLVLEIKEFGFLTLT
jgi:hypothetical protein